MTAFADLPIHKRVALIEEALAKALHRGDFEVTSDKGERYLRPILDGHVMAEAIWTRPLLSLDAVAREMERLLS